jgi:5-methylcytosine-specific restriction endonuclease McrA
MVFKKCIICNKEFIIKSSQHIYCSVNCRNKINYYQLAKAQGKVSILLQQRFRIFIRDNFKCCYCGRQPNKDNDVVLQIDHIIPRAKGGYDTDDNLQTTCKECNLGKRDIILEKRKLVNTDI